MVGRWFPLQLRGRVTAVNGSPPRAGCWWVDHCSAGKGVCVCRLGRPGLLTKLPTSSRRMERGGASEASFWHWWGSCSGWDAVSALRSLAGLRRPGLTRRGYGAQRSGAAAPTTVAGGAEAGGTGGPWVPRWDDRQPDWRPSPGSPDLSCSS